MVKRRRKQLVRYTEPYIGWRPSLVISYGISNYGFGEISFVNTKDHPRLVCDSEYSTKYRVKTIVNHLVNNSLFSDLVATEKQVKKLTLKALSKLAPWGTRQSGFVMAFTHEEKDGISQYRWKYKNGKVINLWVKDEFLTRDSEGELPNVAVYSQQLSENGVGQEFIKAELWSWIDTPKNPDVMK